MKTIEQVVRADQDLMLREIIKSRMADALKSQYAYPLGYPTWGIEEIMEALECLCEQRTTMWTKVELFEQEFAKYLGTTYAVMVNSGSSADLVMMLAAKEIGMLKTGDEILIPVVTWPTQVWAAIQAGFNVKFVDVDSATLNTSPAILKDAVTPKTKAIFLVHLMGNPCDMEGIRDLDIPIFEDCCEALGASFDNANVGAFGVASSFSFFASHHISTMEGGMIATDNHDFADACRSIRAHGWARDVFSDIETLEKYFTVDDARYLFLGMGFNFRPTELQGAIGSVQLERLPGLNATRQKNFERVGLDFRITNGHVVQFLSKTNYKAKPAWFGLPFVLREGLPYSKKQVTLFLEKRGIDTRPIVGGNLMRQPAFFKYPEMSGTFVGANAIHDRGFYIGLPPMDDPLRMDGIIGALNSFDVMLRDQ